MENKEKDLRMVCWVPYNISEIQKGIQCQHGTVEYSKKTFGDTGENIFKDWAENYKTTMIYKGGTTNSRRDESYKDCHRFIGTLNNIQYELEEHGLDYSIFIEPDLNDALTAVCCIIDYSKLDFETDLKDLDKSSLSYFIRDQKFA